MSSPLGPFILQLAGVGTVWGYEERFPIPNLSGSWGFLRCANVVGGGDLLAQLTG
jgi:hypothetical protein